jgi:hypothetical protein
MMPTTTNSSRSVNPQTLPRRPERGKWGGKSESAAHAAAAIAPFTGVVGKHESGGGTRIVADTRWDTSIIAVWSRTAAQLTHSETALGNDR